MAQESDESKKIPDTTVQKTDEYKMIRDIWSDYNDRQKFEHDLINRKTTWWLTTQTILFAAYGVSLNIEFGKGAAAGQPVSGNIVEPALGNIADFRSVVAFVGLAVASVTLIGVSAVIVSKLLSWQAYQAFYHDAPEYLPKPHKKPLPWGVQTLNTWVSLAPDLLMPVIFIVAWTAVLD
jgi:hypothetical protein